MTETDWSDTTFYVEACIWRPENGGADSLNDGTWHVLTTPEALALQQAGEHVEWAVYQRKTPGSRRDVEWRCGCATRADAERIAGLLEADVRGQGRRDLDAAIADRNTATARLQEVDEMRCAALNERDEARALLIEEQQARHAAGTRVAQLEREIADARAALGEGWFVDGVSLATAIERKTIALEMAGQPVRPPALALVAGERWYWRDVDSETAEGPCDSREHALLAARVARGDDDVIVGRCIEVDVTKYIGAEDTLERMNEWASDDFGSDSGYAPFVLRDLKAAEEALKAWAAAHIEKQIEWFWSEGEGEELVSLDAKGGVA